MRKRGGYQKQGRNGEPHAWVATKESVENESLKGNGRGTREGSGASGAAQSDADCSRGEEGTERPAAGLSTVSAYLPLSRDKNADT